MHAFLCRQRTMQVLAHCKIPLQTCVWSGCNLALSLCRACFVSFPLLSSSKIDQRIEEWSANQAFVETSENFRLCNKLHPCHERLFAGSSMASKHWDPWTRAWFLVFMCFLRTSSAEKYPQNQLTSTSSLSANASALPAFRPDKKLPFEKPKQVQGNVRRILNAVNKPAVKSIQSSDGDIIDCVLIDQQPAFDHPKLKGHKIKEFPASRPAYSTKTLNAATGEGQIPAQVWKQSGDCPIGTVPIRRTSVRDIRRSGSSIERFGRKSVDQFRKPVRRDQTWAGDHEHAIAYVSGGQYFGAKATINVWQPTVANPSEFSLSQIWILSGSFNDDLNTIEAGWQVSPELYGDNRPRFFIYWTSDAYQQTGCYNLLCAGFVQTSNEVAMGASISPLSSYRGAQYDIGILIWKDPILGDWWMEFGDRILVGYWPATLFTHLAEEATVVEWGGEVVNGERGGVHTGTEMGSGHFAEEGFGRASYFRNLEVVDRQNELRSMEDLETTTDRANCYDIKLFYNSNWGNFFYYGGPGRNPKCP